MEDTNTGHWASQYVRAGWALIPFERGRKGPTSRAWNLPQRCVTDPDTAAEIDGNVGLAHAYSRTCVVDVDDLAVATDWLSGHGIDLAELMEAVDAVMISSGRPNRGKLLYRLPAGVDPLPSRSPTGSGLELRCATGAGLTVQDVLPPSIHPDTGKPYVWKLGIMADWACPPVLPDAVLALWQSQVRVQDVEQTQAPAGVTPERLRGILSRLDPDAEYNEWAKVGAALHHESGGASWGLDIWDEWSATGTKYKSREDLIPHWRSWGRYAGRPVTVQWLISQAGGVQADDFDDLTAVPQQPPKAPKFEVLPLTTFTAGAPPEWFVKGVLARAGLGVIYGESGAGKSFLTLDMLMAIALGRDWNGKRVRQGRVVYACAEGQAGFRNRVKAYCKVHGIDPDNLPFGVITDVPNLLANDHKAVSKQVNAWGGAEILGIDTYAQVTPGANENSSEDMGKALTHIRLIHAETGAMPLLVHHSGKDTTRGARGWSGLKAAADSELEVLRDQEQRSLRVSKQKDGEDGWMLPFRLEPVELGTDPDGDPITSCVVRYDVELSPERARAPKNLLQRIVWETALGCMDLCDGLIPVETLLAEVAKQLPYDPDQKDSRKGQVLTALKALVMDHWLTHEDGFLSVPERYRGA